MSDTDTIAIPLAGEANGTESFEVTFNNNDTNRKCGSCTLCCKLLPVQDIGKKANTRCRHQSAAKGCKVYHQPEAGFPFSCAVWSCQWLTESSTARLQRPDRSGYVIDNAPDLIRTTDSVTGATIDEILVLQVWVDPARPNAWRDPALGQWIAAKGLPAIIRFGSAKGFVVFPPALSPTGKWFIHTDGEMNTKSKTGSHLLDRIAGYE